MAQDVDQELAEQLLQATRTVLDHLSRWKVEAHDRGEDVPREVATTFGKVRPLRDYLKRCASSYKAVVLDLDDDALNLLVSCAVRQIECYDATPTGGGEPDAADDVDRYRQILAGWARTAATRPVVRVPSQDGPMFTPTAQGVCSAIAARVEAKMDAVVLDTTLLPTALGPDELAPAQLAGHHPVAAKVADTTQTVADGSASWFEPGRVRNLQLRVILAADQAGYRRSLAAGDHRMAAVHLAAALEAAVLDYAMPRARKFGLFGSVEAWKFDEVLMRVLGRRLAAADQMCLLQLIACRNLNRPSHLLTCGVVPGPDVLAQMERLLRRVLVALGLQPRPAPRTASTARLSRAGYKT